MNILLLGRDNSITNTIEQMLCSVHGWSTHRICSMKDDEWQKADKTHKPTPCTVIIANLEGFSLPPPVHAKQICNRLPSVPLLVLHHYKKDFLVKPILDAGATGYAQNNLSEKRLIEAVSTVAEREEYIFTKNT